MLTLATKAALLSAVSAVVACSAHPSRTIPDRSVVINGCTYDAFRVQGGRNDFAWYLRHSTACSSTHTLHHLDHPIYVDTLYPMTITKETP